MPIDIEKDDIQTAIKKLKARENSFRQLEEISRLGSWEVDLKTNKSIWSKRSYDIYGIDYGRDVGLDTFFNALLPKYHKVVKNILDNAMKSGEVKSLSCEIKHSSGKIINILINAQIMYDKDKKPYKIIGTTQDITEYISLKEEAKELSELIQHSSNEIYIIEPRKLNFIYVNQGACDALGYTKEELLKLNVRDINPYLKKEDILKLRELLLPSSKYLNRTIHQRKDNSLYHVQSYIHKIIYKKKTAYVIFSTNITQTIELEQEYKKQAKVLEHIHDSVISTNNAGYILSWNKGSKNLFGYSFEEIKEKHISLIYSNKNKLPIELLTRKLHKNNSLDIEAIMIKKDKSEIICNISLSILRNDNGEFDGYVGYIQDITQHKQTQKLLFEQSQKLRHQAHYDILTDLPNRTLFNERLSQAIVTSKRNREKFALFFIDLDQFKKINDSLGHQIGDKILIEASKRFQSVIREEDTLSRLGGDEFTIILKNIKNPKNAIFIAKKIINSMNKPISIDEHQLHISSSIGISIYPDDTTNELDLIKYADSAMYKAKDEGRNNYQFYSSEMTTQALKRVTLENNLRIAIKEEQFVVYFQPQYDALEDRLIGMEALVRWKHPTQGLIPPFEFIPLAEDTSLIIDIDEIVMKQAMKQFIKWYKDGLNPGKLALNLSMRQLNKDDFIDKLKNIITTLGFNTKWLELEVTEGQIMNNPKKAIEKLNAINSLGIEIAIDDFGTGYSSLSYLKKLPLDKLKIDQSFVRELPNNDEDIAITKAIIAIANSLNFKLIAEGVETQEQKQFLIENGCINIQGYLYSKPVPANEIEKLLN